MDPGEIREVEIAVSPGHTWLTARTEAVAWFVRETIAAAGLAYGNALQGGRLVELIVDVGVDGPARAACEALAAMGVQFTWHMDQDPDVRRGGWESKLPGLEN